jgi:hypothetical protein
VGKNSVTATAAAAAATIKFKPFFLEMKINNQNRTHFQFFF